MSALNMFAQITKVDEEKRLVTGRAVQEVPDKADEIFDYESSKPHFKAWSDEFAKDTEGKSLGNLRAMHGKVAAGKLTGIDFNDTDKAIDISAKVVDDNEWGKVLEGVYTGFSIGGSYVGERRAEKIGDRELKRYTAKPAEISLVDSPCVPSAKFFEVHKKNGETTKVEFKTAEAQMSEAPPRVSPDATSASSAASVKKDLEVKGTDKQVADFAEFLNREGLSMADALERLSVEAMLDDIENMAKREFSADERKKAAESGHALPDGSFPINSVSDLHNAIQAYGRAKDKDKAKAHIIARAKALGAAKDLPESWGDDGEKAYTPADDELIKSALAKPLIESDTDEAFSSNVAAEVKAGKPREQAVAIAYSVQRKARAKKAAEAEMEKVPKDEIAEAMEALARHGELAKMLNDPDLPVIDLARIAEKQLSEDERKSIKDLDSLRKAIMEKARMTQAHMDKIQAIHDHSTTMGAKCDSDDDADKVVKAAGTAQQLEDALKRIVALEKQPVPHVVLTTIAKGQTQKENGTATDDMWLTTRPYSELIKHADGTIDWASSAKALEGKRPT